MQKPRSIFRLFYKSERGKKYLDLNSICFKIADTVEPQNSPTLFWPHKNVTIWVREGYQKNKKLDFCQSLSKSFFIIELIIRIINKNRILILCEILQVPKYSQSTQTDTHILIVTTFLVSRKCDYLEALQYL